MDRMGQPLCWFAVNRWVTGGAWLPSARLAARLAHVPIAAPRLALVERWLAAMLRLYAPEPCILLARRDRTLTGIKAARSADDVRRDRAVYVVAGALRYGANVRRSGGTKP